MFSFQNKIQKLLYTWKKLSTTHVKKNCFSEALIWIIFGGESKSLCPFQKTM